MKNNMDSEVLGKLNAIGFIDKQKKLAFNDGKKHAHNSLTDDLKEITSDLSIEYNRMSQIKDDSYLMGFRAAMMIAYRGIDNILEDNKLINNDKSEDRTPQKRVLTKKVIATLKDMGNKAVLLHDKNIKTMARVWVSNEYGVKVADPFDRNRHYNRVLNDFTMLEDEDELISLASAAKRVYLTTFVLKSRIEKGYYSLTSDDIIVKNKSGRKYMYLSKNKVDKIVKFEIDKALELVNDFRAHGWKFEYDKVDQIENGYWIDKNKPNTEVNDGSIPRVTYTPYVFRQTRISLLILLQIAGIALMNYGYTLLM